ncbi:hypothetical protein KPL74_03420 [Bacillus sp. NP157]|nr:hypothetical protein KPL74_03420 [Bacillus sp. NP157]
MREGTLPVAGIQRILVCRPNHRLGNTVLTTPLMVELERRYPGAEIDVLSAGAAASSVYGGFVALGDLHVLDRRAVRHPLATLQLLGALRKKRYDLVIDAASGSSSGRFVASMARSRFHLSADAARQGAPAHFAARPVHALRWALGVDDAEPVPAMDLRLSDAERACGSAKLERVLGAGSVAHGPVLAIFPNATGAKRYDEAWWTTFLAELERSAGQFRIVELVAADGVSRVGNRYPTFFTSDPRKLAAFIDAAGLYVSADCGVMHLAAATRAHTIGLFARTDPKRYAPYGGANAAVWTGDDDAATSAHRVASHVLKQRNAR